MKRSTFSILFFIKKNEPKKSGLSTIMIRLTIDHKQIQFNSKLEIEPQYWDQTTNRVLNICPKATEINRDLNKIRNRLLSLYVELSNERLVASPIKIKNAYLGYRDKASLLYVFNEHIKILRKRIGKNLTQYSCDKYQVTLNRLLDFLEKEYGLSDIQINDIDIRFLELFHLFLMDEYNCANNTALKYIQRFATVMIYAERTGILIKNPFIHFRYDYDKTETVYLTQKEVNSISNKHFITKRLNQVKDVFLFSCYTGLAFSDIQALTRHDIYEHLEDNKLWIKIHRKKTNHPAHIPILPLVKDIIDKYNCEINNKPIFPAITNQKMNEYLKEIAAVCGIDKNLSFHVARHTFATTVTLSKGVSIESISKMSGHTNIKTTQIYARITDNKISDDMNNLAGKIKGLQTKFAANQ